MNFAEQLAYWYLRLNGFFPITNFVLHQGAEHRTSDADLVAVRFPFVSEDIGGNPDDWHEVFRDRWEIELMEEIVGLIVEVKSGRWQPDDLVDPDRAWLIEEALRRMGMMDRNGIAAACLELRRHPITRRGGFTLAKLFIGDGGMPEGIPWLHLELEAIEAFIQRRMRNYANRKSNDRLFFSGDLIQYLAWRSGVE